MPNVLVGAATTGYEVEDGTITPDVLFETFSEFLLSPQESPISAIGLMLFERDLVETYLDTLLDLPSKLDPWADPREPQDFHVGIRASGGDELILPDIDDPRPLVMMYTVEETPAGAEVLSVVETEVRHTSYEGVVDQLLSVAREPLSQLIRRRQRKCMPRKDTMLCSSTACEGKCLTYKKSGENGRVYICTCVH
jgi:hypothetical protein